jgi:HK97 family phage major capsid protein
MADAIEELRTSVEALAEEIRTLADADTLDTDQEARFDAALTEFDTASENLAKAEERAAKVAKVAEFAARPGAVKPAIEPINVNTRSDVFDTAELRDLPHGRYEAEVQARALTAIEADSRAADHLTDDQRDELTSKVQGRRSRTAVAIAELVLRTGSDAYREAFDDYISDPGNSWRKMELDRMSAEINERAAHTIPLQAGALAIPYALDPTVILTNAGTINPVRSLAKVVQIAGTNQYNFTTSAGISAGLITEGAEVGDNTPTFTSTSITAYKHGAYAFGSYESISDSGWDGELAMMFADAKDRYEAGYLTTGTGSAQPQGIITFASNTTSVVAGTSGASFSMDFVNGDVYNLRAQLSPRWRGNSVWMANLATANAIRQFGTQTNPHAFTLDLQANAIPQLLGRPFYEVSDMDSTVVSGSTDFVLLHGDPSQFCVVDRVGASILYQPIVTGASGRPTGQAGWVVYWRAGSGGMVQDAFRLLRV